ncbi:MAG: DUF3343 domain-containing protein [Clostridia bacterium]|nr:DUF3343 domain-containing protein [Clostridia bacterium]
MKWAIVVFKSKAEVFEFIELLNQAGIGATTTQTPKEAGIGCGISAKVGFNRLPTVKKILSSGRFSGAFGVYAVVTDGVRTSRSRII